MWLPTFVSHGLQESIVIFPLKEEVSHKPPWTDAIGGSHAREQIDDNKFRLMRKLIDDPLSFFFYLLVDSTDSLRFFH